MIADVIAHVIRERGPMTVAAFMELALYDSEFGYYARAAQRSGRAGDFFTSVDVGPLFGELLAIQVVEMARQATVVGGQSSVDLVEAGAGNGRLAADILRALRRRDPALYERIRLHLVEVSPEARQAQPEVLGDVADRLVCSAAELPQSFEGILVANEMIDALPVHQVVAREGGLREVLVGLASARGGPRLIAQEGPLSTPALTEYFARLGICLENGWRAEVNLRALEWVRDAARRLRRGFVILIDYGHEAEHLYSARHATGTLTTFAAHRSSSEEGNGGSSWLERPGAQDLTAHVDFTSVRSAAEDAGFATLGFLDQTYFVLGLLNGFSEPGLSAPFDDIHNRLALKTLLMPGGLGSTHKVLLLGKDVGKPSLLGCSYGQRVT